jgi:hypothetical protein
VQRRDSAGVEIVEISASTLDALPVWRIADTPSLSVGELDGDPEYLFTAMAGARVAVLDSALAIVDGSGRDGTLEIRIFDAEGRFLRKVGRAGSGPGEFRVAPAIRPGDHGGLVALESNRITVVGPLAEAVRSAPAFPVDCPQGECTVAAVLADGRVVHERSQRPPDPAASELAGRVIEGLGTAYSIEDGGRSREVATMSIPTHYWVRQVRNDGAESAVALPAMFESWAEAFAGRSHIAITSADRRELRLFDAGGRLMRIVRLEIAPRPIADEQAAAIRAKTQSGTGSTQLDWPIAKSWPPFEQMRFGENDDLWLWDYRNDLFTSPEDPERITILASDGEPVARLEVRPDPLYADQNRARDHVVVSSRDVFRVVTTDGLGVNRLVAFPIVKD